MHNVYKITNNNLDTFYFRRQDYFYNTTSEFRAYDSYLKIFRVLEGEAVWKKIDEEIEHYFEIFG